MPLDPVAKTIIELTEAHFPRLGTEVLDAAEARRILAAQPARAAVPVPVARVEDRRVPGPAGAPEVPVRLYWPREGADGGLPVVVFCHGGGFVICDLDSHDGICRDLANATGALVVSVDYRRAPEHRFPAAAEDAYAVLCWAAAHAAEEGGDPARVAVAGDSAGGNLAAVLPLMARDQGGPMPVFQLLIYPMLDPARNTPSYRQNARGYFVTADHLRWYWEQYLGADGDGNGDGDVHPCTDVHPYASPLAAADLSGLPPAHILTAEYDPLRDEGEAYGRRLREAGVAVDVRRYDGVFHGFFGMPGQLPAAAEANEAAHAALRTALNR
ncbi:alpha/beta hydrolase [Streptomyces ochraceiscleroticus]|uniref:Alpha/beta hydrolase n=1 Tax=Streptomyces ochraceiscleroticus TaxID=47761 RepID=A0ABW1MKD9_9ACTN|nr:alpha/beta hydrolase [Streptomyces ochraceiscleroticus]